MYNTHQRIQELSIEREMEGPPCTTHIEGREKEITGLDLKHVGKKDQHVPHTSRGEKGERVTERNHRIGSQACRREGPACTAHTSREREGSLEGSKLSKH